MTHPRHASTGALRRIALGLGIAGAIGPVASELRIVRSQRRLTDRWEHVPIERRGPTLAGISYRPRQVDTFGMDPQATLGTLLAYPFEVIRLGAYWDRIEPDPAAFRPDELDWQVAAAEAAGKQVVLCVGAVKTFGYPECFVPAHHRGEPLQEGILVEPSTHPRLLSAALGFVTRIVERYRDREAVVAWQVEHEAVDPLGLEHSWRLSRAFVQAEVEAVRAADPARPIMMNGFLATSSPVRLQQWWSTRDQGDSLAVAEQLADIVGIDFYPRNALAALGALTIYLDGGKRPWQQRRRKQLSSWVAQPGRRVMIAEGQAEPWEAVTTPPSPEDREMYSCGPAELIGNYNQCLRWSSEPAPAPWAYLFWGAEYWLLRQHQGDPRYLGAFARVLAEGAG